MIGSKVPEMHLVRFSDFIVMSETQNLVSSTRDQLSDICGLQTADVDALLVCLCSAAHPQSSQEDASHPCSHSWTRGHQLQLRASLLLTVSPVQQRWRKQQLHKPRAQLDNKRTGSQPCKRHTEEAVVFRDPECACSTPAGQNVATARHQTPHSTRPSLVFKFVQEILTSDLTFECILASRLSRMNSCTHKRCAWCWKEIQNNFIEIFLQLIRKKKKPE